MCADGARDPRLTMLSRGPGGPGHSGLTLNGQDQALRLARYFRDRPVSFTRVFSSDLDRATDTARVMCQYQLGSGPALEPIQLPALREQCFGCGSQFVSASNAESMASMKLRVNGFLRDYILPLMADQTQGNDQVVAVVAHGVILQVIWSCLADLFGPQAFHLSRTVGRNDGDYMHPVWSNTGIMELDIRPSGVPEEMVARNAVYISVDPPWITKSAAPTPPGGSPSLEGWSLTILSVDSTMHLSGDALAQTIPDLRPYSTQQSMDDISTNGDCVVSCVFSYFVTTPMMRHDFTQTCSESY